MNETQQKIQRNLAGLEFLMSRPDTRHMLPQSDELDKSELSPAFYVCRAVMRDNLTVVCISLRVTITTFADGGEQYTHRDIHGRGTTFEMALFDLSAQLIKDIGENDIVDIESIPILQERISHGGQSDTSESVRANEPCPPSCSINTAEQDERGGVAARSYDTSGSGTNRGRSKRGRKAANRHSGRGRSKRAG